MKRRVRSALSIFLALAMVVLGLPEWIAANTARAADVTYEKGSSPKDAVALTGEFGFIAFESLRMFGHQHSNVMTGEYIGEWESNRGNNSECTIRDYLRDCESYDNYIQKIRYTDDSSYGAKFGYAPDRLILGESHNVVKINDTQYTIDNVILEESGTVLQESEEWKYIDLANLQKSFAEYSAHLAGMEMADLELQEVVPDLTDMNHLKVDVNKTDSGVAVWNVTADDLASWKEHPVNINFPSGSQAGLLINIDMAGKSEFEMKETMVSLDGGESVLVSNERLYGDSGNNRVYFNFYDSTAVDKQFRGTVTTTNIIVGTIFAPMAELNAPSGNLNGMFVAKNISVKSESHRINPYNLPPAPKKDIDPEVTIEDWTYGDDASEPKLTSGSNPGDGGVTYEYKEKGADDSTYTTTVPEHAGEFTVRATIAETEDYYGGTCETDFEIKKAENPATVTPEASVMRDGHTIDLSGNVSNGVGTVTYEIVGDDNGCSIDETTGELSSGTTSGTVTVKVSFSGDDDYKPATKSIEVTVTDKDTLTATVVMDDWTYGDEASDPQIGGNTVDAGEKIEYKVAGAEDSTYSETKPDKPGNYIVRYTIEETATTEKAVATDDFTINKADRQISVSLDDWTYGDTAAETQVSGDTDGAVVMYRRADETDDAYTTEKPTEAGEYSVRVSVAEDDYYNGCEDTDAFTIYKADLDPSVTLEDWTYGEDANEPVVERNDGNGSVTFEYRKADDSNDWSEDVPTEAGNYKVRALIEATDNYNEAEAIGNFTIDKAENTAEIDGTASVKKSGNTVDLSENVANPAGDVTYEIVGDNKGCTVNPETGEFLSGTETGDVIVKVTVAGDDNHEPTEETITVTVLDKKPIEPIVELDDWTYGDEPKEPMIEGNEGGGAETVEYRKADGSGDWSGEIPTEAGNYEVRVTIDESEDYNGGTATDTFTIRKAENPATIDTDAENEVTKNTVPSDGHSIDLSKLVKNAEGEVTYKIIDGSSGCNVDENGIFTPDGQTGEATVKITVAGDDNHDEKTATVIIAVVDKEAIEPEVTIEGWTYGDSENVPNVAGASNPGDGAVTYQYKKKDADDGAYTDTVPSEAGDYTVRATVAETADYQGGTATADFTIEKAENNVSVDDTASVKKSGNTVDLSENVTDPDGDVTYAISGEDNGCTVDPETGLFTSGSTPCEVTVVVTVAGDDNHESATKTIKVTVTDKQPITPSIELENWAYGDEPNEPEIKGNEGSGEETVEYRRADGSDDWSEDVPYEVGDYEVRVTIGETEDYNGGEATGTFSITKAENPAQIDTAMKNEVTKNTVPEDGHQEDLSGLVSDAEGEVSYEILSGPEGCTVDENGIFTPGAGIGEATVKITVAGNDNYKGTTATVTVKVNDKEEITPEVTIEDWIYGDDANEPDVTDDSNPGDGAVTYQYKKKDADDSEYKNEVPTDAGDYTVRATVAETPDYKGGTATADFTIAKADNTVSVDDTASVKKSGNTYDLSGNVTDPVGDVTYEIIGEANGCTVDQATGEFTSGSTPCEVTVRVTAAGDDNYESASNTITVTVTDKEPINPTIDLEDWAYGDEPNEPDIKGNEGSGDETVEYRREGSSDWSEDVPTEVGNYEVRVTIGETDDYNGGEATGTFSITKAENPAQFDTATENEVTKNTVPEDGHSVDLSGLVSDAEGEVSYEILSGPEGCAVDENGIFTPGSETGEATVQITVAGNDNYEGTTETVTVTVNEKEAIEPDVTIDGWTYGDEANKPDVTDDSNPGEGAVTYQYKQKDADDSTYADEAPTEAGEYTVRATVAETADYLGGTGTADFSIAKAENTAEFDDTASVKRGGKTIDLSDNVTTPVGEVAYEITGEANGCTVDPATGKFTSGDTPCEVTVQVTVAGDKNHEPATETITVTVNDKDEIDPSVELEDWAYGDEPSELKISGNEGNGDVTVEYRKAGSSDEWSEDVPTEVGDYEVRVTIAESDDYNGGEAIGTFSITKAENPAKVDTTAENKVTKNTVPADGHTVDLSDLVSDAEGDVTYSIVSGSEGCTVDENGNFTPGAETGTAIVKITVAGNGNYKGTTATVTVTVEDKEAIEPEVTIEGWTFGDEANDADVTDDSNPGEGAVTYQYKKKGADDSTYTDKVPTGAGEYTVRATVAETADYKSGTGTADFTIEKALNTLSAVEADSVKKGGNTLDISEKISNPIGDVKYEIVGDAKGCTIDPATGVLTTGSQVGTVNVRVTASGDDDHKAGSERIRITIEDKLAIEPEVSLDDWTYGDEANEPEISGNEGKGDVTVEYRKADGSDEWSEKVPTEAGDYEVRVTIAETEDYNGGEATGTFTITKAENPAAIDTTSENEVTKNSIASDDHEIDLSELVSDAEGNVTYEIVSGPEDCTVDENGALTPGATTGTVTVKITVEGNDNYEGTTETVTVTVKDKKEIEPSVTADDRSYGDDAADPVIKGNEGNGDVTVEYRKADGSDEWSEEVPTEAGEYEVRVTIAETDEYKGGEATDTFTIEKTEDPAVIDTGKETEVTVNTIDGDDHSVDISELVEGAEGEVTYKIIDGPEGCEIDEDGNLTPGSESGTVTVEITIADSDNHTGKTETITVTVKDKEKIQPEVTIEDWTYGETEQKPVVTGNEGNGDVTYEYKKKGEDDSAYTTEVPTEAGEYIIRATVEETGEYAGGSDTAEFTIEKAKDPAVIDTTGTTVQVNTTETDDHFVTLDELVSGEFGDVTFEIEDAPEGSRIEDGKFIPGSESGEAVIKVTITDSDNHIGKTAEIVIRITEKETGEIKVSQGDSTYDEKLPDPEYDVPGDDAKVTITYTGTLADGTPYEATGEKPTEAGDYVVTVVVETGDTVYTGKVPFTIEKAVPPIGTVTANEPHNTEDIAEVVLSAGNAKIKGTFALKETKLKSGTNEYHWTFTPDDTANYKTVSGTVTITVTEHDWSEWEVVKKATVTEDGLRKRTCTICGEVETEIIPKLGKTEDEEPKDPEPKDPEPVKVEYSATPEIKWTKDSGISVEIKITRSEDSSKTASQIDVVVLGGTTLAEGKDYTILPDGTVKLSDELMNKQKAGAHTITISFKDGDAVKTKVEVVVTQQKVDVDIESPKTGDLSSRAVFFWFLALLFATTMVLVERKRREEAEAK